MSYNITIEGGKSVRLPTAGKYCDRDIIITAEGGESGNETLDSLIDRSVKKIESDAVRVGADALRNCTSLESVKFPNATTVSNYALYGCTSLENVYFPNVEVIGEAAFSGDSALKKVNFPKVEQMNSSVFSECKALVSADFPNLIYNVGLYSFSRCEALKTANFPKAKSLYNSCFFGCTSLESIDLPNVGTLQQSVFAGCYALKTVVLRSEKICSLSSTNAFTNCYHIHGTANDTYNPNGDKDGYIYVPSALIEDYKNATNWSDFASQFRALEDYTVDGTITGELDQNKI